MSIKEMGNSRKRSTGRTVFKTGSALTLLVLAMAQAGCSSLRADPGSSQAGGQATEAAWSTTGRRDFRRGAYAVLGGGISKLDPDSDPATGVDVNDRVNGGGQISVGADVSRLLSLELHAADLGSAGLSLTSGGSGGRIGYQMYGGSALFYAGKNRHRYKRQGLTAYGRLGLSVMDNEEIGSAQFRKENDTSLLLGAGIEYAWRSGLGLRAEGISFDEDAQYAQLGVIYRMGKRQERRRAIVAEVDNADGTTIAPVGAVAVPKNEYDSTSSSNEVAFTGVSEVVSFRSNSADLSPQTTALLDGVVDALNNRSDVTLYVRGHTDNTGPADYNKQLSKQRAEAVSAYLMERGISQSQLIAEAYGESRPLSPNKTREGRRKNRRVDLFAE